MTVSTTDNQIEYVTGGPAFPIPYRFLQASDIQAVLVKQDGTTEVLSGAQYSVVGAGAQGGGTLTSTYAAGVLATPGASLTIARIMSPVQPTDLRNQGRYLAETQETALDRLTMLIQQAISALTRALVRPFGKNYFDALGYRIANLGNPAQDQDATPRLWVQQYVGSLIEAGQGPVNSAANVLYVGPDGVPYTVQDMSNTSDAIKGAALIGLFRKVMNSEIKTVQDFFSASTLDLWEFAGLVTDKPTPSDPATWEWSPAIQAWLNTAAARGDMVKPPIGMFRHSQKIIRPAFVSMVGRGVTHGEALDKGTIFYYDGTDDGWLTTSPINSVSPTHTYTAHVTFYAPNLQIAKGAFVDESSINIELIRNAFIHNAQGAGVIFDQTILSRVLLNQFEVVGDMSGAGANIWLVNGADRRPGADKQYTNQAVINFNNFNCKSSQARCVLDDGGIAHEYRGNNYNGGRIHLEAKEVNGMIIDGGEWEFASSANIQVKRPLGSVASPNVTIRNAYLFPAPGGIAVDYHPLASDSVVYENNTIYGVAADNLDAVAAQGLTKIKAFGNRNIAGGAAPYNNYGVSGNIAPVVLGATVSGSNSYASRSGRYSREGAMTTVSVSVTLSSKDVAMSGFVDIDCLPTAAGGDAQSGNIALYNGVSFPTNHTQLGVATVPGTTRVRLYTAGSGQVGGALNATGVSSAFSITFDVSYI